MPPLSQSMYGSLFKSTTYFCFFILCLPILSATRPRYSSLITAYLTFKSYPNNENESPSISTRMLNENEVLASEPSAVHSIRDEDQSNVRVDWNFPVKKVKLPEDSTDNFCGESNFNALSRIIGGEAAERGNWPWIVALGYEKSEGHDVIYRCGGTLITAMHVITAAHCTHTTPPKFVLMGVIDLLDSKSGGIALIANIKMHEGYKESNNANDIALLLLQNPVNFTGNIRPACLPLPPVVRNNDYTSYQAYVAGWGTRGFNETSSRFLQWAGLNVLNISICQEAYHKVIKRVIDTRMMCAAHSDWKKDACQGDSGGPLVWSHDDNFYLIGIVSYGYGCARENYPGVYVRVANYTKWIQNAIETLHHP